MTESCSERKLEPGFDAMYSMPSCLMQSTMKSEPQLSWVSVCTCEGVPFSPAAAGGGAVRGAAGAVCASAAGIGLVRPAAPATAAPLRKFRRPTVEVVLAILRLLLPAIRPV